MAVDPHAAGTSAGYFEYFGRCNLVNATKAVLHLSLPVTSSNWAPWPDDLYVASYGSDQFGTRRAHQRDQPPAHSSRKVANAGIVRHDDLRRLLTVSRLPSKEKIYVDFHGALRF